VSPTAAHRRTGGWGSSKALVSIMVAAWAGSSANFVRAETMTGRTFSSADFMKCSSNGIASSKGACAHRVKNKKSHPGIF